MITFFGSIRLSTRQIGSHKPGYAYSLPGSIHCEQVSRCVLVLLLLLYFCDFSVRLCVILLVIIASYLTLFVTLEGSCNTADGC